MFKRFLVFLIALTCILNYCIGQSKVVLSDSISLKIPENNIDYSDYIFSFDDDAIHLYDYITGKSYSFHYNGEFIYSNRIYPYNNRNDALSGASFYANNDKEFYLKTHRLQYFNDSLISTGRIETTFDTVRFLRRHNSNPPFEVSLQDSILIVSVSSCPNDLWVSDNKWSEVRFYQSPGLFAIYDISEFLKAQNSDILNPSSLIGVRSKVYTEIKFLPHIDFISWFFDSKKRQIVYCEEADYHINVIDLKGSVIKSFGERGKFVQDRKVVSIPQLTGTRPERSKQMETARLKGPSYQALFHDNNFVYRIYKAPLKDEYITSDSVFESFDSRRVLDSKREKYLQIYSLSGKNNCIADFQLPLSLSVLNIRDDIVYANKTIDKMNKEVKIYKYKVVLQESKRE